MRAIITRIADRTPKTFCGPQATTLTWGCVIVIMIIAVLLPSSAMGATASWTNGGGDQDWFNGDNWNLGGAVPGAADNAFFAFAGFPAANVGAAGDIGRLVLDNGGALNINAGGHLIDSGQCLLGNSLGSAGHVLVDGGQLDVTTALAIGLSGIGSTLTVSNNGIVNASSWLIPGYGVGSEGRVVLNSGQINIAGPHYVGFDGQGSTTVNDGALTTDSQLLLGVNAGSSGVVTINNGTLTCTALNMGGDGTSELIINHGGKLINSGGFVMNANATITIDGGELLFTATNPITLNTVEWWIYHTPGTWNFGGGDAIARENPDGSISVTATKDTQGDMDGDNYVDEYDLSLFVNDWLLDDCSSEANWDSLCAVNLFDYSFLGSYWKDGVKTEWQVIQTDYPTNDLVIVPYNAGDFGIVADGVTDVTDAIQLALHTISKLGGGALFLPSGNYEVRGTLTIPTRVTLRGDWKQPQAGNPIVGTILQAYAGRGSESGDPFIGLGNCSGVKGIAIWYPEQLATNIQPYPPTIQRTTGGSHTIENVTFVNSYIGFTTYQDSMTGLPFIRHVYGTPLKTGIEIDTLGDVGRTETVHFSPDYWKDSGLPNAPTANQHAQWIYDNGTGVILRRMDWSYFSYVTVEGYRYGVACRYSRFDAKPPNGQCYGFELNNCQTGIYFENTSYPSVLFSRLTIQDAETGLHFSALATNTATFHTCTISASDKAIQIDGGETVLLQNCDIQQGVIEANGGYLTVINSDFGTTATDHIVLNSGVQGASILGNRFTGGVQITNNTSFPVVIDHAPLVVEPMPAYNYKKPTTDFKPAQSDIFVVTKSPYGARADGVSDDTAAFQAALSDAATHGGGTVFVPGGDYRINGNLTIPSGVELRGLFDIPNSTNARGSVLNIYAGRNNSTGTPFIQLESNAGMRGLTFHYPEQIFDENDPVNFGMVPYPYMIRGLGSDIYIINVSATVPYQLLDLATYRCDRHYVDYIYSMPLKTGIHIGGGSTDGQIQNCHFNPGSYSYRSGLYESIPSGTMTNMISLLWRESNPYVFGNITGEVLHQNFVFGGVYGVRLIEEGGSGPSGHCLGFGIDQCTVALKIDDIGAGGLEFINTQLVSIDRTSNGRYLETGSSFGDLARLFNTACWGGPNESVEVNSGQLELLLFHIAHPGSEMAYDINGTAHLNLVGGTAINYIGDFHQIESTATADFVGNIINTDITQMPTDTLNVTSIGNIKRQ